MKKHIFSITLACLTIFAATGCTEENLQQNEEGEGLKITLTCGNETKTTQDGVGNENFIKTVDVFLFTDTNQDYTYRFNAEVLANNSYTVYIGSVYATESSYSVYTIVNYPGSSSDLGDNNTNKFTLAELEEKVLAETTNRTFTAIDGSSNVTVAAEDDMFFVMTGIVDNVPINTTGGSNLIGETTIDLYRLASKVTMDFYLQDELENDVNGDGSVIETWTPSSDLSTVRAYLCNGNQSINIGCNVPVVSTASRFDYAPSNSKTAITGKTGYTNAFTTQAFYSYPESWTQGDVNEPYIKLIVPWTLTRTTASGTTTSQKETYYKVMLPTDNFAKNTWYHFQVDVSQLGGTSDSDAVPVIPSYKVALWGTENVVYSQLVQSYYLSVAEENKDLDIYTSSIEIPFIASGPVSFSSVTITSTDFSSLTPTTTTHDNATVGWVAYDNDNGVVTINRPIADNFPSSYDVSKYDFTIILQLDADPTNYTDTINVTQYPPMFVTNLATLASDSNDSVSVFVNGYHGYEFPSFSATPAYGKTEEKSLPKHTQYLGSVARPAVALSAATNKNSNMYTITATIIDMQLDIDGGTYDVVIGDPRGAATAEYASGDEALTGEHAGTSSSLSTYRPTGTDTKNIIAPKFMTASSYGKTLYTSYEAAVKRCASYQEYGYPAGRWRLPTAAEILFLMRLSKDNKIPSLFEIPNSTVAYWAAGKEAYTMDGSFVDLSTATLSLPGSYFTYTTTSSATYTVATRCVYDTWYWGDTHSSTTNGSWLGFKPNLTDIF